MYLPRSFVIFALMKATSVFIDDTVNYPIYKKGHDSLSGYTLLELSSNNNALWHRKINVIRISIRSNMMDSRTVIFLLSKAFFGNGRVRMFCRIGSF